jgi:hypothetical protein
MGELYNKFKREKMEGEKKIKVFVNIYRNQSYDRELQHRASPIKITTKYIFAFESKNNLFCYVKLSSLLKRCRCI